MKKKTKTTQSKGDLPSAQKASVKLIERVGTQLAQDHPEIAEIYLKKGKSSKYEEIAESYLGDSYNPNIAKRIVGYAIRILIPEEVRSDLNSRKAANRLESLFGGFDTESFSGHCRAAARKKHENGSQIDIEAILKAKGQVAWTEAEKLDALKFIENGLMYKEAAAVLNLRYHSGEEVRRTRSVQSLVYDIRSGRRKIRDEKET